MSNPRPNFGAAPPPASMAFGRPEYRFDTVAAAAAWSVSGERYDAIPAADTRLPSGFFECQVDNYGKPFLRHMEISTDQLVPLPDPAADMLLKEFTGFWTRAEKLSSKGFSVKRGLLLWGPPGSGKTSAIHAMASHMTRELGGVVIMAGQPEITIACLTSFRQVEPSRPLIVLYEDIDTLVERFGDAGYLSLLDGEHQLANVVNVATTNYPERLDRRFADRPGRFDRVQYVGMPSAEARRAYFLARMPDIEEGRLERWVIKSEDWSIAHLRELVIATEVLGDDDSETIERVNDMRITPDSGREPGRQNMGFAA